MKDEDNTSEESQPKPAAVGKSRTMVRMSIYLMPPIFILIGACWYFDIPVWVVPIGIAYLVIVVTIPLFAMHKYAKRNDPDWPDFW